MENYLKYLKRGQNRKERKETKDFEKRRQAGPRSGCLKKGRAGTPLRTMAKQKLNTVLENMQPPINVMFT